MNIYCDECQGSVQDREDLKFSFSQSDKYKTYDVSFNLCSKCFDKKFSILRFAKLSAKDNQLRSAISSKNFCCLCDNKVNKNKDEHHLVKCFDYKISLEILYCVNCFEDDVGFT